MDNHPQTQHDPHGDTNGEPRYEVSDIQPKPLGAAALGFTIFTVVMFALSVLIYLVVTNNTWNIFGYYIQSPDSVSIGPGSQPANAQNMRMPPPPNPILQSNLTATVDMNVMRQDARHVLETAAWVNEDEGIIRIPLERAIEISVQSGLPFTATGSGEVAPQPIAQTSPMAAPAISEPERVKETPVE